MEVQEIKLNWWQRSLMRFLKLGAVPKHIGFIMDGNRRFARNANIITLQGHELGYLSLTNALTLGLEVGVKEVTTYALSIENLNRPKDELNGLWRLMRVKLEKMLQELDKCYEKQVAVSIVGNLSLLPKDLESTCYKINEKMSRVRDPVMVCYLAICYTSRDEMTSSLKQVLHDVNNGVLEVSDIDDKVVQECFYKSVYPVDMIVRTSGETRLSDFLLWQCSDAVLYFTDVLWPEFDQWEMLKSLFYFQFCCMKKVEKRNELAVSDGEEMNKKFIKDVERDLRIETFIHLNKVRKHNLFKSNSGITAVVN